MIAKKTIVTVVIVISAVFFRNVKEYSPIVEISSGKLQGIKSVSRDGREFFQFLKIPYAKAPIGLLRYEAPEEVENWDGIRDSSSSYGPQCIQMNLALNIVEGEENCLFLSVATPKISDEKSTELLPVIVFIHGGIFGFGSGILFGPQYFMDQNVVLISINYRLGSFGFLNTGDGVIRGNMGLKDQNMALRWVQENIIHFGGDPNKVTIFGESAGAASVQYHMVAKMSRGLFHKAIAQSGSALSPWALFDKPMEQAVRFAELLNCTTPTSTNLKSNLAVDVNCLKNLPVEEIMKAHLESITPLHDLITLFVPTVEVDIPDGKTFLSQHPKTILENGQYTKVPMIAGVNSHEGLAWTAMLTRNETAAKMMFSNVEKYLPRIIYLSDDINPLTLKNIQEFYLKGKPLVLSNNLTELENLIQLFSDRIFNVQVQNSAQLFASGSTKSSPVFLYVYAYDSEFTMYDSISAIKGEYDPRIEVAYSVTKQWFRETFLGEKTPKYGVCHVDELMQLLPINLPIKLPFDLPLMPFIRKESVDYNFSKKFVKLWVDFASSPNELDDLKFMGQSWPSQVPGKSIRFFQIDNEPKMIASPFQKSVDFWNSLEI